MIAFSIVFPLTPHFRLFSVFQRVLRLYWEVIVFRLTVLLEFTTFYRHENAPQLCIKIGMRIWLKTLILIQCTLWIIEGCIFVWAKSYRFRLKIGEGANWSRATYIGQLHIQSARKFAYKRTTNSRHSHPVAPNLLNRNFQISTPNTVWVGDIINSAIKYR